ncbi:hypothetical protein [Cecembia lonarensis]|uniref:DUF4168 domain-containing protein n=1 Tax=Cecembia lonarensis (strain CCUG 58316 / KCTC 22772 / LW9) TaxID=1225176 RepID=K1LGI3_CECL9|nr:hypothetical protein [Cecembia lonarensis]EKB49403.1 hypothetical protein B879_01972 [Cecembia lonarensis LW9]
MKKLFLLAFLMLGMISVQSYAQDESEELTEEEMVKYAAMEAKVQAFIKEKQTTMEEMIKENETLGGGARYNEIKGAWGNDEKLAEIEATEEEKEAFAEIQAYIDAIGDEVKEYMTGLIMDAEVLGAATYNKVRRAMNADPAVKEQINNLVAELQNQEEGDEAESEEK